MINPGSDIGRNPQKHEDYRKVEKIILSCKNFQQMKVALNTILNFSTTHQDDLLVERLEGRWFEHLEVIQ